MNKSLKAPYTVTALVFCMLISVLYLTSNYDGSVFSVRSINPGSQLAQVGGAATLSLTSAAPTPVNSTFIVNIIMNTGGGAVYGLDINHLHFNPNMLQVVDSDSATPGVQISPGSLMSINVQNTVDNNAGIVQFSQVSDFESTFTGSGIVASITFRVIAAGTSNVTIDFVQGNSIDSNIAGLGGDILTSVTGGSYTGTAVVEPPPADTKAPTISNITFSNLTGTGITIAWTTDENSDTQVEYGLTSNYGSQIALINTSSLSHSATLSDLSPGTSYHYRVKSRDSAGNLGVSSDNIFTTQTSPDTTAPTVPAGLTATPTGDTQIQLSWTASVDLAGAGQSVSGIARYQIFRDGTLLGTSPTTAYLDTGLIANTSYSYQIAAVDVVGNVSAKSASVNAIIQSANSIEVQRKVILSLEGAPTNGKAVSGTIEFIDPTTRSKIFQSSITTDSNGQYIMNVPAGLAAMVILRAKIPGYISKLIANVDLRNTAVLEVSFPKLSAGDFNGDQTINSLDFSYMNDKWGTQTGQLADINRDGAVNSIDFSYLSSNWLMTGE